VTGPCCAQVAKTWHAGRRLDGVTLRDLLHLRVLGACCLASPTRRMQRRCETRRTSSRAAASGGFGSAAGCSSRGRTALCRRSRSNSRRTTCSEDRRRRSTLRLRQERPRRPWRVRPRHAAHPPSAQSGWASAALARPSENWSAPSSGNAPLKASQDNGCGFKSGFKRHRGARVAGAPGLLLGAGTVDPAEHQPRKHWSNAVVCVCRGNIEGKHIRGST